jgi:hypothetical protein
MLSAPSTRKSLVQSKKSLYSSLLIAKAGEKFERTHHPFTNSDLQFEADVEVSDLDIETEGRSLKKTEWYRTRTAPTPLSKTEASEETLSN